MPPPSPAPHSPDQVDGKSSSSQPQNTQNNRNTSESSPTDRPDGNVQETPPAKPSSAPPTSDDGGRSGDTPAPRDISRDKKATRLNNSSSSRGSSMDDGAARRQQQTNKPYSDALDQDNEDAISDSESEDSARVRYRRARDGRRGSSYDFVAVHGGECNHGTFSPRLKSPLARLSTTDTSDSESDHGFGGRYPNASNSLPRRIMGDAVVDGVGRDNGKKISTTKRLAKKHGIKNTRLMYIGYYIPFFTWIKQYKWSFLRGDLSAALTMASFYIPMALSYASNLGHIPAINGLYTFVFNPLIYALLGSCPQMVVGPEAAGSLLLGTVVKDSVERGHIGEDDAIANSRVAGVVTGISGAVIFIAGLSRLGFLESVLSRPFLRGFISAVGFVIFVDQAVPELGLDKVLADEGLSHGSSAAKIEFLFRHIADSHKLTAAVSFTAFAVIMITRTTKSKLQPRFPAVAYVPDRFVVVVVSALLTWHFHWEQNGLEVIGTIKSASGKAFDFRWPFQNMHMHHIREAMSTSFLISLLGFFESSVAAKSLGTGESRNEDSVKGVTLSANRELIALGAANIIGGCFMALPGFGGYGRSKVNKSTGGKTPMSSIFLSLFTLLCILFLLPYFYYIPKGVLSAMVSVVAYSLIEEAPGDIKFFWRIRGWAELALMAAIFLATVFYSLTLGIALGVGISLVSVIKHSTRPRIQILGRVPGTNLFENAEENPDSLEFIEGCLIVKIPEPLTFANTGDLKSRLRRLELYGTNLAHPALPRVRNPEHNNNIIFDIHGVTGLDGSGTQVLAEIVQGYRDQNVRVIFCRVPSRNGLVFKQLVKSGIVEMCGGYRHFVKGVEQALRLSELESLTEHFRDHPEEGV